MPNGGVPMHMTLYPKSGNLVLYCCAGELQIWGREDWRQKNSDGKPLCTLTEAEGSALAWQLRDWLGEKALRPGYDMGDEIRADYYF
jgi:hypothetical protein